jgi:hypothetical protein
MDGRLSFFSLHRLLRYDTLAYHGLLHPDLAPASKWIF